MKKLRKNENGFNVLGLIVGTSVVLIFMMITLIFFLRFTTIEPGWTGIKINKIGSNRGVSKENLVSGLVFYSPITTRVVEYPTFNQRVAWTGDVNEGHPTNEELTFQTKDSVPVKLDVAVNYTLNPAKVPEFYTQFRADNIDTFTHGYMRDQARNAINDIGSEYTFDEVNGDKKEEFFGKVNANLAKIVEPYGVILAKNGITAIGALRPPENLKNAVNAKVQAIQDAIRSENQLRQIKADAAKAVAQAQGEAAANIAKAHSITPQLIEWKKLEIQEIQAKKWNGVTPTTVLGGNSSILYNMK